jgi:hypothetical protein
VRECLLSFSAEPFVFQFAIQKHKDQYTESCNVSCSCVLVCSLVSRTEGVQEYGAEGDYKMRSFMICTPYQILFR